MDGWRKKRVERQMKMEVRREWEEKSRDVKK